ncbi:MAG TPA: hypothetical protein VIF83_02410 [Gemmatimonadaceae bacterium]|jgi:hypothetical protein
MKRLDVEETPTTNASGSSVTINANIQWFRENERYADSQASLAHYSHIALIVNREIQNAGEMLYFGDGGFFDYDTTRVDHATALDSFPNEGGRSVSKHNLAKRVDSHMAFETGRFDFILPQNRSPYSVFDDHDPPSPGGRDETTRGRSAPGCRVSAGQMHRSCDEARVLAAGGRRAGRSPGLAAVHSRSTARGDAR